MMYHTYTRPQALLKDKHYWVWSFSVDPSTVSSVSDPYRDRVLSFSEVDTNFVEPLFSGPLNIAHTTCPSFGNTKQGQSVRVCPEYTIYDYDPFRSPTTFLQVNQWPKCTVI